MLPALHLTNFITSFELRKYFREEENFELGLENKYLCVKKKKKRKICKKVKPHMQMQMQICANLGFPRTQQGTQQSQMQSV